MEKLTDIDAASFATRTAHVAAGELFGLLMHEDGHREPDWFGSQGGDLATEVPHLADFLIKQKIDNPETIWRYGMASGIVRREAPDWRSLGFARRQAFATFTRVCSETFRAIREVQERIEAEREAQARARAQPRLKREDSILEDREPLGKLVDGAEEFLRKDAAIARANRRKFNGADPKKFDHDGDGKPGGSKKKAAAPAAKPKARTVGEPPAKQPVNRGGRGRKKPAADRKTS